MHIISLGGVGGCDLAYALRSLNRPTYPYNWLITTQSFVILSFNNISNFFTFDDNSLLHGDTMLRDKHKKAVMLHDFTNYALEKESVIKKYERRFNRLQEALEDGQEILFVRIYDNLEESLQPEHVYEPIFEREQEDIAKWSAFASELGKKYGKKIRLLIITNRKDIFNTFFQNVVVRFTKEYKNSEKIKQLIEEEM